MAEPKRKLLLFGLMAAIAVVLVYVSIGSKDVADSVPLPSPNGYDDFLRATNLLRASFDQRRTYTLEELRAIVATNAAALKQVRAGLGRPCRVPLAIGHEYSGIAQQRLDALKAFGPAFVAEGRLAENEGRAADALASYIDAIQFAHEMRRGGLVLDSMVGFSFERLAVNGLLATMPNLKPEQLKVLASTLETVDSKREPWSEVIAREKRYMKALSSVWEYSVGRVMLAIAGQNKLIAEMAKTAQARIQLLLLEGALRSYRAETGDYPEELTQLSPKVLKAIPRDPFSGRPYVYQKTSAAFTLYSLGPDGRDGGGKQGDILSASSW